MAGLGDSDREIVAMLLETKAVDFEAIGKTIGAHGAKFIAEDDGWIRFCGSDLRVYKWPRPNFELEGLNELRVLVRELPNKQIG